MKAQYYNSVTNAVQPVSWVKPNLRCVMYIIKIEATDLLFNPTIK